MSQSSYYERYSFCDEQIATPPLQDLGIAIVIPCYNEPDLIGCLDALWNCARSGGSVEVIVVINSPIGCAPQVHAQNERTYKEAADWVAQHADPRLVFHLLYLPNLPRKHAGVGLARKIGMDEAARRFDTVRKPGGIIAGYDADCRCDPNYLTEIERHFQERPRCPGCSIYFEHPLEGALEPRVYDAIISYELHLRYYIQALRYAEFPHAHHTIGSCMAVRANVYKKQGGMNKREAGEDFYFLHKVIPLGGFSDLTATRVIPSARPSDRVPFGTGKAVLTFLQESKAPTYALEAFLDLKAVFAKIPNFASNGGKAIPQIMSTFSEAMQTFLAKQKFEKALDEIRKNTADEAAFRNRFFRWFNAFLAMKFIHHARDEFYGERKVEEEAAKLLRTLSLSQTVPENAPALELLHAYRALDRSNRALGASS